MTFLASGCHESSNMMVNIVYTGPNVHPTETSASTCPRKLGKVSNSVSVGCTYRPGIEIIIPLRQLTHPRASKFYLPAG